RVLFRSRYAYIDLLLFQNKKMEALDSIKMLKGDIKSHGLYDEVLYLEASIQQELGNFDTALVLLDEMIENYHYDILGDDALYLKGKILEENKKESAAAIETFTQFLIRYPGSIYSAD